MKLLATVAMFMAGLATCSVGAAAHSFNVGLVVAFTESTDIRQAQDGFLLAARERDSHPDEESDGHLGGLDVYLYPVDLERESLGGIRVLLRDRHIDILAIIASDEVTESVVRLFADSNALMLRPGRVQPSSRDGFETAFQAAFGYRPSESATASYNAARRIDAAVRPLGGVDDRAALRRALDETRNGLDW